MFTLLKNTIDIYATISRFGYLVNKSRLVSYSHIWLFCYIWDTETS
jgi:hypothetical protein